MNKHVNEKSDSVIVLMKPSNNEGLPSAETVEGRTLPEGNGDQETAVRTQSRIAAISAISGGTLGKELVEIVAPAVSQKADFLEAQSGAQ